MVAKKIDDHRGQRLGVSIEGVLNPDPHRREQLGVEVMAVGQDMGTRRHGRSLVAVTMMMNERLPAIGDEQMEAGEGRLSESPIELEGRCAPVRQAEQRAYQITSGRRVGLWLRAASVRDGDAEATGIEAEPSAAGALVPGRQIRYRARLPARRRPGSRAELVPIRAQPQRHVAIRLPYEDQDTHHSRDRNDTGVDHALPAKPWVSGAHFTPGAARIRLYHPRSEITSID